MQLTAVNQLLFNGVMAVVTITAIWSARRGRPAACMLAMLSVGVASVLLALGLAEDAFGGMRCLAYGLFGFLAATSAASAAILWRRHRRWAAGCLACFLTLEGIAVDSFWIEPHWLEVTRVTIASEKLTAPLKVALLADLQTDEIGDYERSVIERIVAEKPDLVLLAGDYVQEATDRRREQVQAKLCRLIHICGLSAPLGVYAVRGNVDSGDWEDCFSGTEVTTVRRSRMFEAGELAITCLSMRDSFSPRLSVPASDRFHIVLGHCPNFALGDVPADLLLAGHCHGGQVRLPGIGPLITHSRVPRSWSTGVTELGGGRALIVSRGIGMERGAAPPLRFLCRPELVFIDLVPREHGRGKRR